MFDKFRRTEEFFCFQEPCNEALIDLDIRPDSFLKQPDFDNIVLRHPALDAPYFYEFYLIREHLKGLFKKPFSYDEFFTGPQLTSAQAEYFGTLIEAAPNRPLLQFCRSAGRVGALKNAFGGCHVHLWREPRGQWWSYKISSYFDASIQAIYGAPQLPEVLGSIRVLARFRPFHGRSVNREISFYRSHPMSARESYLMFFGLWLYAFIEYEQHAAVTICINKLHDPEYREKTVSVLAEAGIGVLNFDDAKLMHSTFSDPELGFYENIEDEVVKVFHECGYAKEKVAVALEKGRAQVRLIPELTIDALTEELHKLRVLALNHWAPTEPPVEKRRFLRVPGFS